MKQSCPSNAILVKAIDEGLSIMCGSAAPSIIFFLENNGSMKPKINIENLESFSEGLESIFGFGSKVIERKILEVLCLKFSLPQVTEVPYNFEFAEEVQKVFELYEADRPTHQTTTTRQRLDKLSPQAISSSKECKEICVNSGARTVDD